MTTATATAVRPASRPRPQADGVASLAPADRATAWRRRVGAIAVAIVLGFVLTVAIGRVTAGADLADPVAGHHVLQPGESLWEVAAATAPADRDTRDQLTRIAELNGFTSPHLEAWTVVLVPVG